MTAHSDLRLLPWSGPDGKPCYLSTDDDNSRLSCLADTIEAIQLGLAARLVSDALEVLADKATEPEELRQLSADLTQALEDTIRVAISRGQRLPVLDITTREEGEEGPQLQPAAFG